MGPGYQPNIERASSGRELTRLGNPDITSHSFVNRLTHLTLAASVGITSLFGIRDSEAAPSDPALYGSAPHMKDITPLWATTRGQGIIAAVIEPDNGIPNINHEDLRGQQIILMGPGNIGFHPTAASGIMFATADNGLGSAGVSPGLSRLEAFPASSLDDITADIDRARIDGVKILSISGGAYNITSDDKMQSAINAAVASGMVIFAGAGDLGPGVRAVPAVLNNVISVGFQDEDGSVSYGSGKGKVYTYGSQYAPFSDSESDTSSYGALSASSGATPYVAGLGALILASGVDNNVAGTNSDKVLYRMTKTGIILPDGSIALNPSHIFDPIPPFIPPTEVPPTLTPTLVPTVRPTEVPPTLTLVPTATWTPVPTITQTPANGQPSCEPGKRNPVTLSPVERQGNQLIVVVTAGTGNLAGLEVDSSLKAKIASADNQVVITPVDPRHDRIVVTRTRPGAVLVPLIVTDGCGPWKTFIGDGASGAIQRNEANISSINKEIENQYFRDFTGLLLPKQRIGLSYPY